ncbi:hypothetical protein HDU97_008927, partial [Phlyctochytrium planicorne]
PPEPHRFFSIPGVYCVMYVAAKLRLAHKRRALTSLLSVWDREIKLRKIYLMEKLLSSRVGCTLEEIQNLSITDLIRKARGETAPPIEIKISSRLERWKVWWRRNVLIVWEDDLLKQRYMAWRQEAFVKNMRTIFLILGVFDLYSAFLYSYRFKLPLLPCLILVKLLQP